MKNSSKVLSLVGLATRAGKTVSGEFSAKSPSKQEKAFLFWWPKTRQKIHGRNSGTCAIFTKYRFMFLEIKRNWENTAEGNSAPALRFRMKILRKQS